LGVLGSEKDWSWGQNGLEDLELTEFDLDITSDIATFAFAVASSLSL
jgi:hypothetical protein